jgi:hypothetical protein
MTTPSKSPSMTKVLKSNLKGFGKQVKKTVTFSSFRTNNKGTTDSEREASQSSPEEVSTMTKSVTFTGDTVVVTEEITAPNKEVSRSTKFFSAIDYQALSMKDLMDDEDKDLTTAANEYNDAATPSNNNSKSMSKSVTENSLSRSTVSKSSTQSNTKSFRRTIRNIFTKKTLTAEEQQLAESFPQATPAEITRFLTGRTLARANEKMVNYFAFREEHLLDELHDTLPPDSTDVQVWNHACSFTATNLMDPPVELNGPLPRVIRMTHNGNDFKAKDDKRVIYVIPALIDTNQAPLTLYATATALYLDLKIDRNFNEALHVAVDVRAGKGWANAKPTTVLPFASQLSKVLADTFPERMTKTLVYPVPWVAKPVWGLAKKLLDPKHVKKIELYYGPADVTSPLPKEMESFLPENDLNAMEESRKGDFVVKK